jgi:hypothetical protein
MAAACAAVIAIAAPACPFFVAARSRAASSGRRALRPCRPLPAVAPVLVRPAASPAAVRWHIREVGPLLISHMPHAERDSNENDHDSGSQSDHERSHLTIQLAMTSRTAQARHARP